MKRSATDVQPEQPPLKRQGLETWLDVAPPKPPSPICTSSPITDRQSTFVAHAAPVSTQLQAVAFQSHVRALRASSHPSEADHEVMAYRILAPRPGKSGLGSEDDWAAKVGIDDDGEKNAGSTVRKVLEELGQLDVCCVVSRYYGGIMLGPVRFDHIRAVAKEAVSALAGALALPPLLTQLRELDSKISAQLRNETSKRPTDPDYRSLTVEAAERLIKGRQKRLDLLSRRAAQQQVTHQGDLQESSDASAPSSSRDESARK